MAAMSSGNQASTFLQSLPAKERQQLLRRAALFVPGTTDVCSAQLCKLFKTAMPTDGVLNNRLARKEQTPDGGMQAAPQDSEWETARLRVRAASIAAENDSLKMSLKEATEANAALEAALRVAENNAKTQTSATEKAAAHDVAHMEEQVAKYKQMLEELASSAELLSKDNVMLSTEVMQLRSRCHHEKDQGALLESRLGQLQELYLTAVEDDSALFNRERRALDAKLDELATDEVLSLTRPPASFPVPLEHRDPGNISEAIAEIQSLRRQVVNMQQELAKVETARFEAQQALDKAQAQRKAEKAAYQSDASKVHQRLLGAMRRLVYVADQVSAKDAAIKQHEAYIVRLEQQLLQRHNSEQTAVSATTTKSIGARTRKGVASKRTAAPHRDAATQCSPASARAAAVPSAHLDATERDAPLDDAHARAMRAVAARFGMAQVPESVAGDSPLSRSPCASPVGHVPQSGNAQRERSTSRAHDQHQSRLRSSADPGTAPAARRDAPTGSATTKRAPVKHSGYAASHQFTTQRVQHAAVHASPQEGATPMDEAGTPMQTSLSRAAARNRKRMQSGAAQSGGTGTSNARTAATQGTRAPGAILPHDSQQRERGASEEAGQSAEGVDTAGRLPLTPTEAGLSHFASIVQELDTDLHAITSSAGRSQPAEVAAHLSRQPHRGPWAAPATLRVPDGLDSGTALHLQGRAEALSTSNHQAGYVRKESAHSASTSASFDEAIWDKYMVAIDDMERRIMALDPSLSRLDHVADTLDTEADQSFGHAATWATDDVACRSGHSEGWAIGEGQEALATDT